MSGRRIVIAALAALSIYACSGQADLPEPPATGGSGGGSTRGGGTSSGGSTAATTGGGQGQSVGTSGANSSTGATGSATSTGDDGTISGGGSSASGSDGGVPAEAGASGTDGGTSAHSLDHCLYGYDPDPSDSDPAMKDGPADYYPPGNTDPSIVDTTVQPQVLGWMQNNFWEDAHVEWHAIRACNIPGGGGMASHVNICSYTQLIPKDQNCQTAGDGYQFLVFHRHMIHALKQLWPHHTEQFTAFPKFPTSAADVPPEWRSAWKDWDADTLAAGKIGDEIDKPENLARFPDEGTLGFWLQCNVGQKLAGATNMPWVGLHFALHAKWARPGNTAHGVNNTNVNIDNYMFWKLHGWIDNVWEKYRLARGMKPDDQKLKDDLVQQCREMDTEIQIIKNTLKKDGGGEPDAGGPLPVESGFFHEMVRPIFESKSNLCSGCHAESGANAMLTLGGHISSKDIVQGLVNRPSIDGGQYKLVVPGDPDHSWLYLKAAGKAATAGCQPTSTAQCITGVMPPSSGGPTVTAQELQILRQWIQDGAAGPS